MTFADFQWLLTWLAVIVLALLLLGRCDVAQARDGTFEWTPASGPVGIYIVYMSHPPCAESYRIIGGTAAPEFLVKDAHLWEPFCISVKPFTWDGTKEGPVSLPSEVRDEGWSPPLLPMPVPEPGRLVMLVAGIPAILLLRRM